jgi:hypothetical protein
MQPFSVFILAIVFSGVVGFGTNAVSGISPGCVRVALIRVYCCLSVRRSMTPGDICQRAWTGRGRCKLGGCRRLMLREDHNEFGTLASHLQVYHILMAVDHLVGAIGRSRLP